MSILTEVFPPLEVALKLEPEELAVPLLECLCKIEESQKNAGLLNRYTFTLDRNFEGYSKTENYYDIATAVSEAWMWLEKEGLIAPSPGQRDRDWVFVTSRGRVFRKMGDPKRFKEAKYLPREVLDPQLVAKARPPFLRGEYDSAVFEAFKEVEIRIRKLSSGDKADIGINLMRKAFHPQNGPLTDKTQTPGERQAISDLFAGAIGLFKNPSSHHDVDFDNPAEVSELIMFADQLIRIVGRRKRKP